MTEEQLRQQELLKKLKAVGTDLWGREPGTTQKTEPAPEPEAENKTCSPEKALISNLWKSADETVDWTDALAYLHSPDGLIGEKLWDFYHTRAEKVLAGDVETYGEVLRTVNPLGDLTPFAAGMKIRIPDADCLEAVFECHEGCYREEPALYLAALSLRIARDLLAVLPVCKVRVKGTCREKSVLEVTYTREQMRHRQFAFLDPVDFCTSCGGQMTKGDAAGEN